MPVKSHPPNPHRGLERFPLLTDTDPGTDRCINVWIPDSPEYLELFGTAMRWLMNGFKYERDLTHKGEAQARAFTRAYAAHLLSGCEGDCVPNLQFRQTDCLLEYSLDSGLTWQTAYTGDDCLTARIADGTILGGSAIDDAIAAGKIASASQPGPQTPPVVGGCVRFNVTLQANQVWHCPVPVGDRDTITVTGTFGGWHDGNVLDPWRCPDGYVFALGSCGGAQTTESTDPAPTIKHMRLVGNIQADWFDLYNTTHVVPDGTGESELFIQANDSQLNDNSGSSTFIVEICNVAWCYRIDFTASDGGFSASNNTEWSPNAQAVYSAGTGWIQQQCVNVNNGGHSSILQLSKTFASPFTVLSVRAVYDYTHGSLVYNPTTSLAVLNGATQVGLAQSATPDTDGTNKVLTINTPLTIDTVTLYCNPALYAPPGSDGYATLKSIQFTGSGTNPFGSSNC